LLPEVSDCFKNVPLQLNKLGEEKKSHILASSYSRAAEAAAPNADQLRAEAHTFVQRTAEQLIAENSELRAKLKLEERKTEAIEAPNSQEAS